jgi:hypothetical protein
MNTPARSWTRAFSPHGYFNRVPAPAVQEQLRQAWRRWGQPQALRVDNGSPWGSWSDLPPPLSLWLLGLDLQVIWNDPHCPQQNGVVERSQRTGQNWAEPGRCATVVELQQRLDESAQLQREEYPHHAGQSRWQLFPQLRHSGRRWSLRREEQTWDLQRVLAHLSSYEVARRVDGGGKLSLYNRNHYVGVKHAYQTVYVRLDPQEQQWIIADARGQQLRIREANELTRQAIRSLAVSGNK